MTENNGSAQEDIFCKRHPTEKTGIKCASCGVPICTKCMVVTPVGMKCRDCGRNNNSALSNITASKLIVAGLMSIVAGFIAAMIGSMGFFILILSLPFGYFTGNTILKAVGMKHNTMLEVATAAGIIIGAFGLKTIAEQIPITVLIMDPTFMIAVVVTIAAAISKIRYF